MPLLKLDTNISIEKEKIQPLMTSLSALLAKETGKSERYIMVTIEAENTMLFSGNDNPVAYMECKSIGLSAQQASALSASINQLISEQLKIDPDRQYIEFSNCPAEYWGWNGSTFG